MPLQQLVHTKEKGTNTTNITKVKIFDQFAINNNSTAGKIWHHSDQEKEILLNIHTTFEIWGHLFLELSQPKQTPYSTAGKIRHHSDQKKRILLNIHTTFEIWGHLFLELSQPKQTPFSA